MTPSSFNDQLKRFQHVFMETDCSGLLAPQSFVLGDSETQCNPFNQIILAVKHGIFSSAIPVKKISGYKFKTEIQQQLLYL